MRSLSVLFLFSCFVWGCIPSGTISPYLDQPKPISESAYPGDSLHSVPPFVKIVQNNSLVSTGSFISSDGLILSSYDPALPAMAEMSTPGSLKLADGFAAMDPSSEIHIEGLAIHIEIEQRDVTKQLRSGLRDSSFNYQIYNHIEEEKKKLIEEITAERDDLIALIHDRYSGNRFMLTVYRVVDDVRLVAAPGLNLDMQSLTNTELLSEQVRNTFSVLRAYDQNGDPLETPSHLSLKADPLPPDDTVYAAGYPSKSYRLDSHIAFEYYYKHTNPYLLLNYQNYLAKEDLLSESDPGYALRSATARLQTYDNIMWYEQVQKSMVEDSLIRLKEQEAESFKTWAQQDSLRNEEYGRIYYYIEQAFEIAEQSGDIYFATNYFMTLSVLDELTGLFRKLVESFESGQIPPSAVEQTIQVQQQVLDQIDIGSELIFFGDALFMIQTVPDDQIPLAIYDLFEGLDESLKDKLIDRFLEEQQYESFLFDTAKARKVIEENRFYNDRLFVILDEIIATRDFAQNNYRRHYAYLYPAQQVLVRGMLERDPELTAEMDGYLFVNGGSILKDTTFSDDQLLSSIDFSAKAPGAAILSNSGDLVGIHTSNHPELAANNYLYDPARSRLSILTAQKIFSVLKEEDVPSWILKNAGLINSSDGEEP